MMNERLSVRGGTPAARSRPARPLWNPGAAANWSLLFTPAFGAYIQMRNWEILGEQEKAEASRTWFWTLLACQIGLDIFAIQRAVNGDIKGYAGVTYGLSLLACWYVASGRHQIALVKEKYGSNYLRKGWGKPVVYGVLFSLLNWVACVALIFVIGGLLKP